MKVFRYSKNEYRRNYRRYLPSTDYNFKRFSLTRTGLDDKTCEMSLLGYPMMPASFENSDAEMFDGLVEQIKAEKSQILAIQVDPMPYMYRAREWSINNVAGNVDQQWLKQQKGIFGDDYMLESEREEFDQNKADQKPSRLSKKMHSLYFPFTWQESIVNSANIMMLSGEIKNMKEAQYISNALLSKPDEENSTSIEERKKFQKILMERSVEALFTP